MKKLFSCLLTLLLLLQLLPCAVSAEEEPDPEPAPYAYVVGIRVRTVKLVQGRHMDPEGLRYDLVSVLQNSWDIERIVYLTDMGETVSAQMCWDELEEYFGCAPVLTDDQDVSPWGLGDHTAHLSVGEFETDFTVVIEENPVQSLTAADRYCIVNWDDLPTKNEEGLPECRVDIDSPEVGLYCINGWTYTEAEAWELAEEYHESITFRLPEGETWNTEPLTVGDEHTVLCEAFGLTAAYSVHAVESPVETLTAEDVETYAWAGDYGWSWNDETDTSFYEYNVFWDVTEHMAFTFAEDAPYVPQLDWDIPFYYARVLLADGTQYDFSQELPMGDTMLTLNCLGKEIQVCWRVLPSPVAQVELEWSELWERIDQSKYTYVWNPETEDWEEASPYRFDQLTAVVRFLDGTEVRSRLSGLDAAIEEATGTPARHRPDRDQRAYENGAWDYGAHEMELYLLGQVYTLPVQVAPCPVEAFSVDDLSFTAHTHGSWQPCRIWNEETGEYEPDPDRQWYCYDIDPQIALTMTDGSLLTGTPEEIEAATGHEVWINFGQDEAYPLLPGKRELIVWFAGGEEFTDTFFLTIFSDVVFDDVPADAWYAEAVQWALNNNITNGTSDTAFSPKKTCTRAQVVTFLWRAYGCQQFEEMYDFTFDDVKPGAWYADAVSWAAWKEITSGTSETSFGPNKPCTRAQAVTFLWRAAGCPAPVQETCPFTDVRADAFYRSAVLWAVEQGITNGTSDTAFSPNKPCTRAQIVTFLYRALSASEQTPEG